MLIGGSEFVTNFNFMPKVLGGKQSLFSSWLIKRGTKSALARNIAGLGKLVDWTVATGIHVSANAVEESAQEGLQDLMMQTYEMLAKGDFTGYDLGRTWSAVKGGFETAPFLYAQGLVMNAAGNAVGGYIPLCEDQYPAMLALTNYGLSSHPDSKAYQEATKILSYKHKVTVGNMASLITAIEADAADPRIAKLNETLAQNAYSADKTVTSLFYGGLEGVDTTEVDQAKKEVGAAKHKLAEADSAYNTAAGQYLSVMQEDMQNGFLLTDAKHDMYLKFVEVAKKGLDSAKEVFSVLSEKFQQAKDGLDKLLSGIISTARAEGRNSALNEFSSDIDASSQDTGMQKDGFLADDGVITEMPSPENVSIDGDAAGNDSIPLAPNDGSGIINEGTQGEAGYGAGDAEDAAGQVAEDAGEKTAIRIYTPVEYKGTVKVNGEVKDVSRRVYQRHDIDIDYFDETTGLTNLERMQAGKPPIGSDGSPIELHHVLQQEIGPMAELREITHQIYFSQLHGLIGNGASFRNNPLLNKQYNNFRYNYWKWRASLISGGK